MEENKKLEIEVKGVKYWLDYNTYMQAINFYEERKRELLGDFCYYLLK